MRAGQQTAARSTGKSDSAIPSVNGYVLWRITADAAREVSLCFGPARKEAAGVTSVVWVWLNEENRRAPREIAMMLNVLFLHGVKKAMLLAGRDDLLKEI